MRLAPGDTVGRIADLYSRPVNARWIVVHMIDETARHAGHVDLLADCLGVK